MSFRLLAKARHILGEFQKLLTIETFIMRQHARLLYRRDSTRAFFTHLVRLAMSDSYERQAKIPIIDVFRLYPKLDGQAVLVTNEYRLRSHNSALLQGSILTTKELETICGLAKCLHPKCVFEFGTHRGFTTYNLTLNVPPDCRVITLDRNPIIEPPAVMAAGLQGIQIVTADSLTYDFSRLAGTVDLIFVDGGHDFDSVRSDSENALRMVRPGGVVLWHDYSPMLPDVHRYLDELASSVELKLLEGTSLAIYTKPFPVDCTSHV